MWSAQAFGSEVVRSPNAHTARQSQTPFQDHSSGSSPSHGLQYRQRQSTLGHTDFALEEGHGQGCSQPLMPQHRDSGANGAVAGMNNILTEAVASLVLKPIKTKTSGGSSLLKSAISIMDNSPDSAWHKPKNRWLAPKVVVSVVLGVAFLLAFSQVLWSLHYVHTPDACNPTYPTIANHPHSDHVGSHTFDPSDIPVDSKARIAILTMHDTRTEPMPSDMTEWIAIAPGTTTDILDLVWENRKAYAERHGYALVDGTAHVDPGRPVSWSKIKIVLDYMDQYDWVVWMDPDAWITNPSITLESLIPSQGYGDLVITQDAAGFAAGVFMVRSGDWGRNFMSEWWGMDRFVRKPGDTKAGDNDALKVHLRTMPPDEFEKHVRVPVQCAMNSYLWRRSMRQWIRYVINPTAIAAGAWRPTHFLMHLAGWNKVKGLRMLFSTLDLQTKLPGAGALRTASVQGDALPRARKFLVDVQLPLPASFDAKASLDALSKGGEPCPGTSFGGAIPTADSDAPRQRPQEALGRKGAWPQANADGGVGGGQAAVPLQADDDDGADDIVTDEFAATVADEPLAAKSRSSAEAGAAKTSVAGNSTESSARSGEEAAERQAASSGGGSDGDDAESNAGVLQASAQGAASGGSGAAEGGPAAQESHPDGLRETAHRLADRVRAQGEHRQAQEFAMHERFVGTPDVGALHHATLPLEGTAQPDEIARLQAAPQPELLEETLLSLVDEVMTAVGQAESSKSRSLDEEEQQAVRTQGSGETGLGDGNSVGVGPKLQSRKMLV